MGYVALTPDRDFAESPAYHHAVEALERGGILEPVPVPGVTADYRLLRVVLAQVPVRDANSVFGFRSSHTYTWSIDAPR